MQNIVTLTQTRLDTHTEPRNRDSKKIINEKIEKETETLGKFVDIF